MIHVRIDTTDEALVGPEGWGTYNANASVDQFLEMVMAKIQQVYPNDEIVVEGGSSGYISGDDFLNDSDEAAGIREIISRVWNAWEWLTK